MAQKVFLNDKLIDSKNAFVSVSDGGFLYGAGLFETMRSYNGIVFAAANHIERLFESAKALSINNTYEKEYVIDAIYQVLDANKLTEARLRLTLTGGPMNDSEKPQSTLLITATQMRPYPDEYYKKGVLVVLSPYRQNAADPTHGHKTLNYFSRIMALNHAHAKKAAEALWFSTDNHLAEGCITNVFLVKQGKLFTPPLSTPVLAGVARKTVLAIAKKNSVEINEKDLFIDDLLAADEVFLTNAIMQVMPAIAFEKHTVGNGKPGPVAKNIKQSFEELVKKECGKRK